MKEGTFCPLKSSFRRKDTAERWKEEIALEKGEISICGSVPHSNEKKLSLFMIKHKFSSPNTL